MNEEVGAILYAYVFFYLCLFFILFLYFFYFLLWLRNPSPAFKFTGVISKKKQQYILRHYPNWGGPPFRPPYFLPIYFWHRVDHVDPPSPPRIFDKNHEILGFETYIHYYPYYFLRVRGTDK